MKGLFLLLLLIASLPTFANRAEMKKLIKLTNGTFYATSVPTGYRAVNLGSIAMKGGLRSYITKTTTQKLKDWSEYVLTSGEFDHVTLAKRKAIAANPLAQLKVPALLEVETVFSIYKGSKLIGYFINITDHVQAAIFQDGAWYDSFFDEELNLVESFDQSA